MGTDTASMTTTSVTLDRRPRILEQIAQDLLELGLTRADRRQVRRDVSKKVDGPALAPPIQRENLPCNGTHVHRLERDLASGGRCTKA